MGVLLILLTLGLLLAGIFGWLWLCAGFRRGGWRGGVGLVGLQISALCLVYALLRGQPMVAVFTALLPPLAVTELAAMLPFLTFLRAVAWGVAPYALGVLAVCVVAKPLRPWGPVLTGLAAMVAALPVGDQISQAAMCQTAAGRGFVAFDRSSFMESLTDAPQEFQFTLHAKAEVAGQSLGWSYGAMDWYAIPETARQNVSAGARFQCP